MSTIGLESAREILAAQPFSHLVGASLTSFTDGEATIELEIGDRHRQQFGLVHGGVIAYCADNALTFAAGTVLGANILTTEISVKYLRAVRDGRLRTSATVDDCDGEVATCSATIEAVQADGSTTLCAVASGQARVSIGSRAKS